MKAIILEGPWYPTSAYQDNPTGCSKLSVFRITVRASWIIEIESVRNLWTDFMCCLSHSQKRYYSCEILLTQARCLIQAASSSLNNHWSLASISKMLYVTLSCMNFSIIQHIKYGLFSPRRRLWSISYAAYVTNARISGLYKIDANWDFEL